MLKNIFKHKKIFILITSVIVLCVISVSIYAFNNSMVWTEENKNYIKWVDFSPTCEALEQTAKLDIDSHNNGDTVQYNWIELLSYLACKYGGNFKKFKTEDLTKLTQKLQSGISMDNITKDLKNYSYYFEAYDAVLHEFIGEYRIEVSDNQTANKDEENSELSQETQKHYISKYGIKAFAPIAKNYSFSHYEDFGNSRSYGYKRVHLGNDLLGSIGTPIIAVESGTIEALGWNQYGGWRIGIRSFDKKRYYYYAHLRKNNPYVQSLQEGQTVQAGDVIGYLGMTRV